MKTITLCLTSAATLLALSACGTIHDRATNYQKAQEAKPLIIPKGITTVRIGEQAYPVPVLKNAPASTGPVITPPGFDAKAILAREKAEKAAAKKA
jgi:hypothetical protein